MVFRDRNLCIEIVARMVLRHWAENQEKYVEQNCTVVYLTFIYKRQLILIYAHCDLKYSGHVENHYICVER